MSVIRRLNALDDLNRAAEFIQGQSGPDRAVRFLREAEATILQLARMPGLGTRYATGAPALVEVRYFPNHRHREFLIFYRTISDGIEILRVLHGSRDIHEALGEDPPVDENDAGD